MMTKQRPVRHGIRAVFDINSPQSIREFLATRSRHMPSGCIEWTGCHTHGYGVVQQNNVQWQAHRLAMYAEMKCRPLVSHVLHHCDNGLCINPKHLYAGTDADNTRDKIMRRRAPHMQRLSVVDVDYIRNNPAKLSLATLSKKFNVGVSAIKRVRNRRSYRWQL